MIEKIEASLFFSFFFPIKQLFIEIAMLPVKILVKNLDTFRTEDVCQKDQILTRSVAISAPLFQPLREERQTQRRQRSPTHTFPHTLPYTPVPSRCS